MPQNTSDFSDILLHDCAQNPPYLNRRGICTFILFIACGTLCFICHLISDADFVLFFAAAAAAIALLMAADHSIAILQWRALRKKDVQTEISLESETVEETTPFVITLTICNPLSIALYINAIRWTTTDNIRIQPPPDEPIRISPCETSTLTFRAKTAQVGPANLLGIGFLISSPMRCFFAEEHHELQKQIQVVPADFVHKHAQNLFPMLEGKLQSRLSSSECDAEIDTIRPYQNSDAARVIAWRYYAKTYELQVWKHTKPADKSLICLIDSGPQMRLTRPDFKSNLGASLSMLLNCISSFTTVTVIVYDEFHAEMIANHVCPNKINSRLKSWLLNALAWQPPSQASKDKTITWNLAAQMLYEDFKLYKGVDFSSTTKTDKKIDLKGLINWAKSDLALQAIDNGKRDEADKIMNSTYQDMLISLIRKRCRMPQPSLMPNPPQLKLAPATKLLAKVLQSPDDNLLWFSDFAVQMDNNAISQISQILKKRRLPAIGICLPMPTYALNFIQSHGEKLRSSNIRKLANEIDFIDDMP